MFRRKFCLNSLLLAVALLFCACAHAQLTFHNDASVNSFTLKAPGVQQSFTRYFGGKRTGSLMQVVAASPQRQSAFLQPQPQQYQQFRQPFAYAQPQFSRYSASSRYQQPSASGALPFEQHYEQPLPPTPNYASYPQATATAAASYAPPQMAAQYAPPHLDYRTAGGQQSALSQTPASGMPSYADQLQQMTESYQQEQLLAQQQQQQQEQLLMDLYKTTPQGQGRAVTDSPGRSQAFYTADQYINFLNRQHQDVFSQQQNQPAGYQFSPMSAYTPGMPSSMNGGSQGMSQYSPSANVSRVNYTNGKLSYNY